MKHLTRNLVAVLLLACGSARSAEPATASVFGTWEVDVSRLPMPAEARPKSVEISFQPSGAGKVSTQVRVTTADGGLMASDSITDLSGTPAKASGNLEADTVSTTLPLPQVLVMQLSLNGHPGSTRIYAVQPDGQTMTETAANYDDHGIPYTRINYFHRKRSAGAASRATAIGSAGIQAALQTNTTGALADTVLHAVRSDPQRVLQLKDQSEAAR